MKKGFTLLELLVVVLIIGILAAVALPQYQRAVAKSRLTEALLYLNTLEKAVDLYIMRNGISEEEVGEQLDFSKLDIELPSLTYHYVGTFSCQTSNTCAQEEIYPFSSGQEPYQLKDNRSSTGTWTRECDYFSSLGEYICLDLGKKGWEISDER